MFERFTESARRALFFARFEVSELGGVAIGAEHILLGILRADEGPTPRVFADAGLSYSDARAAARAREGTRERVPTSTEIPFTDQAKRIFEHAVNEANALGHKHLGNEHLLLGVLREDRSFAAELLGRYGLNLKALREDFAKLPVVPSPEPESPPTKGFLLERVPFDPIMSLERIRLLAEIIANPDTGVENARLQLDEIHHHLDALKRHLASE
jgi:ATP-dependent Clp protease ATP-binding subunit ClpC